MQRAAAAGKEVVLVGAVVGAGVDLRNDDAVGLHGDAAVKLSGRRAHIGAADDGVGLDGDDDLIAVKLGKLTLVAFKDGCHADGLGGVARPINGLFVDDGTVADRQFFLAVEIGIHHQQGGGILAV